MQVDFSNEISKIMNGQNLINYFKSIILAAALIVCDICMEGK
jgi:hypothetical protein